MIKKTEILPSIQTTPEFKRKIEQTCDSLNLHYSTVVIQLLDDWISGKIKLNIESNPDFVLSVNEAFKSEKVQNALGQLDDKYNPKRVYPDAIKA